MNKIILLILVGLTIIPFFKSGLFDVHDPTSAFRLYTLVETIKDGQFPAAWSNLLNFGYGYPLHLFYAPLFNYLGAAIHLFINSYEVSVKMALALATLLGTFGVYTLTIKLGYFNAILASAAFTFLPYRASAIYVRGSYAEYLAMSLLPWVIYFWQKPILRKQDIILSSVVTSFFVLSHNTLILLFIPILILLIFFYQRKNIANALISLSLIFGMTAWFIFPVFFERGFVQVDQIARTTNFHDHFVTLSQLWTGVWGYGGSTAGVEGDQMSFMLGKGQLILAIIGGFYLLIQKKWRSFTLYALIALMSIFLSTTYSIWIWERLPLLAVMQFPWRALALAGIGLSILSANSISFFPKKIQIVAAVGFTLLIVSTNIAYFNPQEYRKYNLDILSSQNNLDPLAKNKIPEYLPVWMRVPLDRSNDGLNRTSTRVYGILYLENTEPLILSTAYMPQWELRLNGLAQPIRPSEDGLIQTVNDIQSGENKVELSWHSTLIEKIGYLLSLVTIVLMIGWWVL